MEGFEEILKVHPFFKDLKPEYTQLILGCASNVRFKPGEFIFREGGDAHQFYLIRGGRVALETFVIGKGAITVETLSEGDVMGWSWLIHPYKWHFDARALLETRAVVIDGMCLRNKCDEDSAFGYEIMKRFSEIMARRLHATRLQILDIYGNH